jgi:hypothetical protein
VTEADVCNACDALARTARWEVESYSDTRRVRTHPGLPDRRYVQRSRGYVLWVELKAPAGKLTQDQHVWLTDELRAGGLATVVDDPAILHKLLNLLARTSSLSRAECARTCSELVSLCAQRGYRAEPTNGRQLGRTGAR